MGLLGAASIEAGLLGAGSGGGSCAAAPYRTPVSQLQWPGGCPASNSCCSEFGYCHPRESWASGAFRDCNGQSNGRPLEAAAVAAEQAAAAGGDTRGLALLGGAGGAGLGAVGAGGAGFGAGGVGYGAGAAGFGAGSAAFGAGGASFGAGGSGFGAAGAGFGAGGARFGAGGAGYGAGAAGGSAGIPIYSAQGAGGPAVGYFYG